jgi:hypothetical protein
MNTLVRITLALTFILLGTTDGISQKWGNKGKVKGNGNVTTKTVSTSDYDAVEVAGFMDVVLKSGQEGTITVVTDDNVHEYVEIESNGGTLTIKIKNHVSISSSKGIKITVPFKDLNRVKLSGSGSIKGNDIIESDTFEAGVTGSGDVELHINASTLDAKVTGSGDLELRGNARDLEVKVTGSGDFEGADLSSDNAQAYVSGSGDIKINARTSIKARVTGSGGIQYSGNPAKSDTKVSGSGKIRSM